MTLKNIFAVIIVLIVSIGGFIFWQKNNATVVNQNSNNKDYRLGSDKIIVFDTQDNREITTIDLSAKEGNFTIPFNPHDVILSPDKKNVWVTITAPQKQIQLMNKALVEKTEGDHHIMMATDQIAIINAVTDKIVRRIQIGVSLDVADLIFTPDSKSLYVAAETGNAIYKIDTKTFKVTDLIQLPPESNPHQLTISADDTKLYARNAAKNKTFLINTKTNAIQKSNETKALPWSSH